MEAWGPQRPLGQEPADGAEPCAVQEAEQVLVGEAATPPVSMVHKRQEAVGPWGSFLQQDAPGAERSQPTLGNFMASLQRSPEAGSYLSNRYENQAT